MWNFAYTHKKLISASIKTLQFKLLPFSAAKKFTLRSILHIVRPSGNKISTAIKCFNPVVGGVTESLPT